MSDLIRGNAIIGQSGGPTAVINQSLVGVVEGLRMGLAASGHVATVYGMRHGVRGLVADDLFDLTSLHQDRLDRLANTPSAGLGSTRDKPDQAYAARVLDACKRHDIRYFFYIGGNDSSDTCRIVRDMAVSANYDLRCFHVPKTVDNDLMENDHTPGFPSAARFVAMACMADFMDNISLPGIKINVVMGRHAGFLTAASVLARRRDRDTEAAPEGTTDGPQLIYCPEVPFDLDRFAADVEAIYSKKGRCHIVVSEGIQDNTGTPIGARLIKNAQVDAHGNVQLSGSGALGDQLGDLLKEKLTPKGGKPPRVRADTFGYIQRCWPDQSIIDQIEARRSGRFAAQLAMQGHGDGSVAIVRTGSGSSAFLGARGEAYASDYKRVDLSAIAARTRHMPAEFLSGHNNVSRAFIEYCLPLVGDLPGFERL
ncbi:MAG: diphosphate--fructose-6-phosphate 1-phosphotransferase [Phycisphaeraceae bacterium]|nr:diphosphate--fructose-6-phosphate 1-phosphotransferase [Phycisphaeraceae bacterium]